MMDLLSETTQKKPVTSLDRTLDSVLEGDFAALNDYFLRVVFPMLLPAMMDLLVLFIGYFAARYLSRIVSQPIRERFDETFGRFVGTVIFYTVMGSLIAAVASKLGAPLGGMTAVLAAAGFAIGLAFQGSLSNFASGVLMIVFRPFKVGDFVNVAGVSGKVNEIDLFTTTLDTPDNRRLIIPNSSISGATIENVSFHAHRRIEVVVGIDYDADLDLTRAALHDALQVFQADTIPGEDRGSSVIMGELGDSAVVWKVRMWVASSEYWTLKEALTTAVKRQLDHAGIGIPYPQLDVHLSRSDINEQSRPRKPRRRSVMRNGAVSSSIEAEHFQPRRPDEHLPYAS